MHYRWGGFKSILALVGFNPRQALSNLRGLPAYFADLRALKAQAHDQLFPFASPYLCLTDRHSESGTTRGHYFHQDLLVAQQIRHNQPTTHIDVGSRVDGFVAHVAAFRPITVIDIRPLPSTIENITFVQGNIMGDLPPGLRQCCDSLSCLHALEHFGLGRYGDPIAYDGHLAGLRNLTRMLKPGGKLYLSTPIGRQRIEFNAHRVFSIRHLLDLLQPDFVVDAFSYVDDQGDLHKHCQLTTDLIDTNAGCGYGCGIFELTLKGGQDTP